MSTEHQQYSTSNQIDVIKEYASNNNMEIVNSFEDEGKSGLRIEGRDALKNLIDTVVKGEANFDTILVYDVSRWGRFQDADESAYYEYICRRAGITVIYCAEQFENDGSPTSTIIKSVKRAMAGEYSRELSSKVFQGQCKLIHLGYRQGGHAGFGLRRMLIDQNGAPKGILKYKEMKSIQTDRIILVPGPREEVEIVNWIYKQFVDYGKPEREIADMLNTQGVKTDLERSWNNATVRQVLINEKYIGNNIFNRRSFKLKKKRIKNPSDMWIRADGAFEGIVDPGLFIRAQEVFRERSKKFTDDELLNMLKALYQKKGWLSSILIDECDSMPSSAVYKNRFKSLIRAYNLVGYVPDCDYSYLEINRRIREMHPKIVETFIAEIQANEATVDYDATTGLIRINEEYSALLVISRCCFTEAGNSRWLIRLNPNLTPDITIAVRLNHTNDAPLDYYLLPSIDITIDKLRLAEQNGVYLDVYRFDNLDFFFSMSCRVKIGVAI